MIYLKILLAIYLGLLFATHVFGNLFGYVRPRSILRNFVPFAHSGWKSTCSKNRIYNIRYMWDDIDFKNFRIE